VGFERPSGLSLLRPLGGLLALVALLATSATRSFSVQAAGICNPQRKAANLNFTLVDVHDRLVPLNSFKGNVVLLNFWATWCEPCKVEIPGLVAMYDKYSSKGVAVIGVSVDDPVLALRPFVTQFNMSYPVLVGLGRDDVERAFGPFYGFPTSVLIGRDGKICKEHVGLTPREQFEREIKALL